MVEAISVVAAAALRFGCRLVAKRMKAAPVAGWRLVFTSFDTFALNGMLLLGLFQAFGLRAAATLLLLNIASHSLVPDRDEKHRVLSHALPVILATVYAVTAATGDIRVMRLAVWLFGALFIVSMTDWFRRYVADLHPDAPPGTPDIEAVKPAVTAAVVVGGAFILLSHEMLRAVLGDVVTILMLGSPALALFPLVAAVMIVFSVADLED